MTEGYKDSDLALPSWDDNKLQGAYMFGVSHILNARLLSDAQLLWVYDAFTARVFQRKMNGLQTAASLPTLKMLSAELDRRTQP